MDLTAHLRVMWRCRWRIMAVSIVIAGAVYTMSASRPDVYQAKALMVVSSGQAAAGGGRIQEDTVFLALSFARLGETRLLVADAVRRSGLAISPAIAMERVGVTAEAGVGYVEVSATGPSPQAARALTRGLSEALEAAIAKRQADELASDVGPLRGQIADLEGQLTNVGPDAPLRPILEERHTALLESLTTRQLLPTDSLVVVSPPDVEDGPVAPKPLRAAVLALLAALVVNAEAAVLLEALSDRFPRENQSEEVLRATGLPVLAEVPNGSGVDVIEAFRTLRANLMFMESPDVVRTVALVSVEPGAGRSFCAVNLAESAAEMGLAVVLVDADMRRPVLHERLGLARAPGLTEVLRGADPLSAVKHPRANQTLGVLPSGSPVDDPVGLLGGAALHQLLRSFPAEFVVVDTPAQSLCADAMTVAFQCDITIVVIDGTSTRRRSVRRLVDSLRLVNAKPIGVVVNRAERAAKPSPYDRLGAGTPAGAVLPS